MLTKNEFIRHILGEAPSMNASALRKATGHIEGFNFVDDVPDVETDEDTRFVTPLLQAAFGDGQDIPRETVIRSTDAVARYIPDEVRFWPKTPTRPHHTLLIETNLTHHELLSIPAFKSRLLAHLDIAEDALARLVAEVLEGFQRGADGLGASALRGQKHDTLCVVSLVDKRDGHRGRLACFGTINASTRGLETFFLTENTRIWDRADARERLSLIYERQFKKLGSPSWQEAFTTTDERHQAEMLLRVCTKKKVVEKEMQEAILDLLDTIARGFGLRKKADSKRRLRAFPLPAEHDIGIDSEDRERKHNGINPFNGVTLRDDRNRLLGYIVYPLKEKSDAEELRRHLKKYNRFHNVLVVYPDSNQANIELWQGREQLTGKLRKGQSHKDAADVVNLLSRFFVVSKAKVRNPPELAEELAYRARYLRRLALKQLEDEPDKGPLRNLYNAFKVALVHDQEEDEFADAFAQTITYGLLTARWLGNEHIAATGERFTRQSALKHLPAASPFLNDLFKSALSVKLDEQRGRLLWLVDDIADLLDRIDVTYVFGEGDKGSDTATDPVIHFYEPFLASYDKNLKNKRGVFFTPRPVVSYIVRKVHELLQTEFGLEDGLASTDTWDDVTKRIKGLKVPRGTNPSDPFVCILDPAIGTGTFLYECIAVIERTMKERWASELCADSWKDERIAGRWNNYVVRNLLPRLHGFELMVASYAVSHLKLSIKLIETGFQPGPQDRIQVFLTNSLEPASVSANSGLAHLFATLAVEAQDVNQIKLSRRFTVIVGNPPYSGHSANKRANWIVNKVHDYKRGFPDLQRPGQAKWLQDDYVKFIRLSEHLLLESSAGILAFITNHSYLTNPTFRGMRSHLCSTFSRIELLDLHGSLKKDEGSRTDESDENVFDIQQGVSIILATRSHAAQSNGPAVLHWDLWGTREEKYRRLSASSSDSGPTARLSPTAPLWLFVPRNEDLLPEYECGMRVPDIFALSGAPAPGMVTTHDQFAVAFTKEEIIKNVELLLGSRNEAEARRLFRLCSQSQWDYETAKRSLNSSVWQEKVLPILYRPFDVRQTVDDSNVAVHRRERALRQMTQTRNVALLTNRQVTAGFRHVLCTRLMANDCALSTASKERTYVFPLYLIQEEGTLEFEPGSRPNFSEAFLRTLAENLRLRRSRKHGLPTGLTPEDIFGYIYAVLHSEIYRSRYAEFLRNDFPRLPYPRSAKVFHKLSGIGQSLMAVHLLETHSTRIAADSLPTVIGDVTTPIEKVEFVSETHTIWLDKRRTAGFQGITKEAWVFRVGGHQVCEKWLKDRRGRRLTEAESDAYRQIAAAIQTTIHLMKEVDEAINKLGGWTNVFDSKVSPR